MIENIDKLLVSKDKDSIYLACTIIREDNSISKRIKNKLFKSISIYDRIRDYSDICRELNREELTINDFSFLPENQRRKALAYHKIQNICDFFNQGYKFTYSSSERRWFPYFIKNASGWSFGVCLCHAGAHSCAAVGCYKEKKSAEFCGKLFLEIYMDIIE